MRLRCRVSRADLDPSPRQNLRPLARRPRETGRQVGEHSDDGLSNFVAGCLATRNPRRLRDPRLPDARRHLGGRGGGGAAFGRALLGAGAAVRAGGSAERQRSRRGLLRVCLRVGRFQRRRGRRSRDRRAGEPGAGSVRQRLRPGRGALRRPWAGAGSGLPAHRAGAVHHRRRRGRRPVRPGTRRVRFQR